MFIPHNCYSYTQLLYIYIIGVIQPVFNDIHQVFPTKIKHTDHSLFFIQNPVFYIIIIVVDLIRILIIIEQQIRLFVIQI